MTLELGMILTYLSFSTLAGGEVQFSRLNSAIPVNEVIDDDAVSILRTIPSCWDDLVHGYGPLLLGEGSGNTTNGSVICFGVEGNVSVTWFGSDEALGGGGKYQFLADKIEFMTEYAFEGWSSVFSKDKVICDFGLISRDLLELHHCSDGTKNRRFSRMDKKDERWFLDDLAGK